MSQPVPVAVLRQFKKFQVERRINALWETVAPDSSVLQRNQLTDSFVCRGASREELDRLHDRILALRAGEKKVLRDMIAGGFQPEQVALFAQSTREERKALADLWLSGAPARERVSQVQQGAQTLSAIKFGGVAGASLLVLVAGIALQHPGIIETSAWTTKLSAVTSREGVEALGIGAERLGMLGTAMAFAGMVYNGATMLASEITREPIDDQLATMRRNLDDRVWGAFRRMNFSSLLLPAGEADVTLVTKELESIPLAYLPLLTHLHPKELVMFLASEDEGRKDMMLRHQPGLEQRILTGRALASSRIKEFSSSLQQTLSAWEGGVETKNSVTLNGTMEALRKARQEKRQLGELPPARPTFGSSVP